MLAAIKYNLANLARLSGRDARPTFWYYVLFLALVHFAVSLAIGISLTGSMMGDALDGARHGASEEQIGASMAAHMGGMLRTTVWASVILSLLTMALLAASFTRRLHDSGKPGWFAAIAIALKVIALALTVVSIADMVRMAVLAQTGDLAEIAGLQRRFVLQGVIGWVPLAMVIVFGAWPSERGENPYGPEPARLN